MSPTIFRKQETMDVKPVISSTRNALNQTSTLLALQKLTNIDHDSDHILKSSKGFSRKRAKEVVDEEIDEPFKIGKKRKKNDERSPAEIAVFVENVMAELEVAAEEDAELNKMGKPAINKRKSSPLLKHLQQEFIDHGVLTLLKNWLEPLPDGSLPNISIRTAVLNILTDHLRIDLQHKEKREQLKQSGLGKVIMFLSKFHEETTSNRKLAKDLVHKWSRPIFNKTTLRVENMRNMEEDCSYTRPAAVRRPASISAAVEFRDGDLDFDISRDRRSGQTSAKQQHVHRPEATPLVFVVRPPSKIDPSAKQPILAHTHQKINKKLQKLKALNKKQFQAIKPSVEGRGMVNYL